VVVVLVWALVVSASMIPFIFGIGCAGYWNDIRIASRVPRCSMLQYASFHTMPCPAPPGDCETHLWILHIFLHYHTCKNHAHDHRILFFQPSTLDCHQVFLGAASISAIRRS
jgi:hypothetical protein